MIRQLIAQPNGSIWGFDTLLKDMWSASVSFTFSSFLNFMAS